MSDIGLFEAMQSTRAVRRLRPDPVPDEVIARLLTAFSWGPSGGNRQPWRVIVVRDPATKAEFHRLYQEPWRVYSDMSRAGIDQLPPKSQDKARRSLAAADHLAEHLDRVPVIFVVCFDPRGLAITDAQLDRPSVVGGASIYPAVQNLLLAARAEGLGCVLTTLLCRSEPELRPLLGIPQPWSLAAFVPVGYPVGKGHGPLSRQPIDTLAFAERWDSPLSLQGAAGD